MKVIKNETVVMIDVDETLVLWRGDNHLPGEGRVRFFDPYDKSPVYLHPHKAHIKLLKDYSARGFAVVVWSAAGFAWAKEVVEVLCLTNYITLVLTKPTRYVDDLQAEEILGTRVYLREDER